MTSYRLTPEARAGFHRILDYVEAQFGLRIAERVLNRLVAAFERLASSPGLGRRREELTDDASIRFWSDSPSVIAYRVVDDVVEILFVERGERDWHGLLREE